MTVKWETVNIFISSTFEDMHAERDYLVKQVFPELREWCERRKLNLVDIDLRWGVREEDTQTKSVVEVCLNNIDKARPFFLCFLGQRRGWVPKASDVSPSTLSQEMFPDLKEAIGNTSVTEMEILHALVNPFHRSRTRKDQTSEYYDPVKYAFFYFRDPSYLKQLPAVLNDVYTNSGARNDDGKKDEAKRLKADQELKRWVTQEIPTVCKENRRPEPRSYTAEWNSAASTPELLLPMECPSETESGIKQWQQKWADAGIILSGTSITDPGQINAAEAYDQQRSSGRLTDFQSHETELRLTILDDLKAAIIERYPDHVEIENLTDLQKEIDQQEQFLHSSSEGFISRGDDFLELNDYVNGSEQKLFVLTAPGGAGKSTLLSKWIETYRIQNESQPNQTIHFRFIGQSDRSTTVYSLLYLLLHEVKEVAGKFPDEIPDDPQRLRQELLKLLETAGKRGKTVIVLDALNQLESGLSDLSWLPYQLPENIKMVVSFKRGEPAVEELLKQMTGQVILSEVKPFSILEDRKKLVKVYLAQYLKDLDERYLEILIHSIGAENPLFLKVILSELRVFGAFSNLKEKIRTDFGETPITAFEGVLKRLENDPAYSPIDPKQAVPFLFGLLSHARQGLSLEELTDLFVEKFQVSAQEAQDTVNLYLRQVRPFLAYRGGMYDFFFESFKMAVQERYVAAASDEALPKRTSQDWHRLLAEYFSPQSLYLNQEKTIPNLHKLFEQPYQQTHGELWSDLKDTLTNIKFLEIKSQHFSVQDIENDFRIGIRYWKGEKVEVDILIAFEERIRLSARHIQQNTELMFPLLYNYLIWTDAPEGPLHEILEKNRTAQHGWLRSVQDPRTVFQQTSHYIEGHIGPVNNVAFSPDGKFALSVGSGDRTIKLWDLNTQRVVQSFEKHGIGSVGTVVFSPDGKTVINSTLGLDPTVNIWDIQTGKLIRSFKADDVRAFAFPDENTLMSYSGYGDIKLWDIQSGKMVQEFISPYLKESRFYNPIYMPPSSPVAISPDGKTALHGIIYWDIRTSHLIHDTEKVHPGNLSTVFFSQTGNLALFSEGESIKLWDLEKNQLLNELHISGPKRLVLSPDGMHLLEGSNNIGKINLWDLQSGQIMLTLDWQASHPGVCQIYSLAISPDGKRALGGYGDGTIKLWDIQSCQLIFSSERVDQTNKVSTIEAVAASSDGITALSYSKSGKVYGSGAQTHTGIQVKLWELQTDQLIRSTETDALFANTTSCISFSKDLKIMITGLPDNSIRLTDLWTGEILRNFIGHQKPITTVAISPDGKSALSGSKDKTIKYWNIQTGEMLASIEEEFEIKQVFYAQDETIGSVINKENQVYYFIKLWDPHTNQLICSPIEIGNSTAIAISPKRDKLLSCSYGAIDIWDLQRGNKLGSFNDKRGIFIRSGNFLVDELSAITSSNDMTVRIWDLSTGKNKAVFASDEWMNRLAASNDGRYVICGDGAGRVWIFEWIK